MQSKKETQRGVKSVSAIYKRLSDFLLRIIISQNEDKRLIYINKLLLLFWVIVVKKQIHRGRRTKVKDLS